ncbi:ASF1 [Brettanomyces bruxellensis]|uniref:Histone chaperone ASF1 n=1 Tax=Dekkera bruxellensis TaxID=5007 RepID=A0A7D9D0S2_DEKBR|nr:ASF1 [Brettanomyces bruxellensis]
MSIVSVLGINVLNNPAKFMDPYEFEITFECLEPLKEDLEWKLTYVGSSRSLDHDQELDSVLVGPVPVGVNKFILTADAPSPELIPANELVSVTVILLTCSYKQREFVRVGYYVNNEYDQEELRQNPPAKVQVDHIVRNILAEKPRVTRFNIVWDNEDENPDDFYPPEQLEEDLEEEDDDDDDESQYGASEEEKEDADDDENEGEGGDEDEGEDEGEDDTEAEEVAPDEEEVKEEEEEEEEKKRRMNQNQKQTSRMLKEGSSTMLHRQTMMKKMVTMMKKTVTMIAAEKATITPRRSRNDPALHLYRHIL